MFVCLLLALVLKKIWACIALILAVQASWCGGSGDHTSCLKRHNFRLMAVRHC